MDSIELQCPSCEQVLELDAGFAGGVCRCSNCGTLMTVPADPHHERAEALRQSGRSSRPESPVSQAPAPSQKPAPQRPAAPVRESTPAGGASAGSSTGVQTFVTASGKTVEIRATAIPTAKRKKRIGVRVVTVVVFVLVMAGVIGMTAYAVSVLMQTQATVGPSGQADGTGGPAAAIPEPYVEKPQGYDPTVNLLKADVPGFMGVPLSGKFAVVVEASTFSRDWLLRMKVHLREVLARSKAAGAQVGFATQRGVRKFPETLRPWTTADMAGLDEFLMPIASLGLADLQPALAQALASGAEQAIVILGRRIDAAELAALRKTLEGKAGVRLDVIVIGDPMSADTPALKELSAGSGGQYMCVSIDAWNRWAQELAASPR